jgi:rhodanese-related sulfurtransferase
MFPVPITFCCRSWASEVGELDRKKPTAIYCASGYRASIATSILKQQGLQ